MAHPGSSHNLASALGDATALPRPPQPRRSRRASRSLSLLISGLIHATVLFAAGFVVWRTAIAPRAGSPGAGVTFDSIGDAPTPTTSSNSSSSSSSSSSASTYSPSAPISAGSLAPLITEPETLSGLSTGAPSPAAPSSIGSFLGPGLSSGSLFGTGPSAAASSAIAGAPTGASSVTFGGLGASSVSSVVYVVDCSGPMVTSLPMVIAELERSVSRLSQSQRFNVVLSRRTTDAAPAAESFAPILVRATPSAKELLHNWLIAAEPSGRSSPLAGVELALSLKPDAVFLLSRSIQRSGGGVWELGLDATMARLEQLNPVRSGLFGSGRPVLIQTIQFLDEDTTGIMQAIGTRHGGGAGYRVVKRQQDLQSPPTLTP